MTKVVEKPANVDRVDLSDFAIEYLEKETDAETDSNADSSEANISEDMATVSESISQDSEDVLASELYSYTETELKDLLLDGDITQSGYDTEIAKHSTTGMAADE